MGRKDSVRDVWADMLRYAVGVQVNCINSLTIINTRGEQPVVNG